MKGRLKWQNFYKSALVSAILAGNASDTTEKSFQISESPTVDKWWIVVDFLDYKREIIFYHRVDGTTIYYYDYNRQHPELNHDIWAIVQLNDVAEYMNWLSQNTEDFWVIKKLENPGLTITVLWWSIKLNNQDIEISDNTFTLSDNTTNYVVLDYTDNTTKVLTDITTFTGIILGEVKTSNWDITSITDKRQHTTAMLFDDVSLSFENWKAIIKDSWVSTSKIADNSITTEKIIDANITTSKIADNNITTEKINDYAVIESKLDNNSVSNRTIQATAISEDKMWDKSISNRTLIDKAITWNKIDDKTITHTNLWDTIVDSNNIIDNAVKTNHLDTASVTTEKINDLSITTSKLANANITTEKIADNAITDVKVDYWIWRSKINKDGSKLLDIADIDASSLADKQWLYWDDQNQVWKIWWDISSNRFIDLIDTWWPYKVTKIIGWDASWTWTDTIYCWDANWAWWDTTYYWSNALYSDFPQYVITEPIDNEWLEFTKVSDILAEPAGSIKMFAGSSSPDWYLLCDGSEVSRSTYVRLFNVIWTTYWAGDWSTTFNLPNLKGRVVVWIDWSQTEFSSLWQVWWEKTHTLSISEIPSHTHDITTNNDTTASDKVRVWWWWSTDWTYTTTATGWWSAHNNLQPYMALNYIIKY